MKEIPDDMKAALAAMDACTTCPSFFRPRGGLFVCNGSMALEESGPFYPPGTPGKCYAGCQWCGRGIEEEDGTPAEAVARWNRVNKERP